MSRFLPSAAEERWIALAARYPALREPIRSRGLAGDWNTSTPRGRIGFFLLGLFIGLMLRTLCGLLGYVPATADHAPSRLELGLFNFTTYILPCLLSIGVAEWLIAKRRLFHSGLEEGLWLAGLVSLIFWLLSASSFNFKHAAAFSALCCLVAGFRLLVPSLVALGAALSSVAIPAGHWSFWNSSDNGFLLIASLYSLSIALIALAASSREFTRPAHDKMLDTLVVVMPLVAFGWAVAASSSPLHLDALVHLRWPNILPLLVPAVFATAAFVVGIRQRRHAALISMLLCKLCIAWELRELTGLSLGSRLMLWGSLALLAAFVIDRWLRQPRWGITTAKLESLADDIVLPEFAHVVPLAAGAQNTAPPATSYHGEGGGFGGGGSSGRF